MADVTALHLMTHFITLYGGHKVSYQHSDGDTNEPSDTLRAMLSYFDAWH